MVKRQKEKQYQSSAEHRLTSQFRSGRSSGNNNPRPLPFDCCALTLTPFINPVCCIVQSDSNTSSKSNSKGNAIDLLNKKKINHGIIFENSEIMPYLLKQKVNPLTGKPMSSQNLITLSIDSAISDGSDNNYKQTWQCPIMNKPFLNHTKIVAVRIKGSNRANVYSYEAYQTLNVKPKNYTDLIDGTKFHPTKDVIVLNDVDDGALAKLRDINNFVHLNTLRKNHQQSSSSGGSGSGQGGSNNVNMSISAKRIMDKLQSKQQKQKEEEEKIKKRKRLEQSEKNRNSDDGKDDYKKMKILTSDLGITYTKGRASGSLTSTALPSPSLLSSVSDIREATEEEILTSLFDTMKKRKQKAFVRMFTNLGNMDIELHVDIAPRTCMNFIGLVEKKWYDGTSFHRLIRNFMIQGGGSRKNDSKTKRRKMVHGKEDMDEEQSIWGRPFQDEFDQRLRHAGPGVVSMANAGKDTNKCQFFITFKSAPHLDNKHSVFGKVVKGLDVLVDMENVPCNMANNRPLEDVYIEKIILFGDNPVADAEEIEKKKILKRMQDRERTSLERKQSALGNSKYRESSTESTGTEQAPSHKDVPKVGQYLQKKKKNRTQFEKQEKNDDVVNSFAIPSRLPAAPKKTTFGDFSGW